MKLNAIQKLPFNAELWDFTTVIDEISGERLQTYFYLSDIKCMIIDEGQSNAITVYSNHPLKFNAQLRNLEDKDGNPVYTNAAGESIPGYVGRGEPIFNVWAKIEGYRYDFARGAE